MFQNLMKHQRGFKTNQGLKGHMKKFHDIVLDALSPAALTARVLFQNPNILESPSTQGNSRGEINYSAVVSEGIHKCGECDNEYTSKEEVPNHMKNAHDKSKLDAIDAQGDKAKAATNIAKIAKICTENISSVFKVSSCFY